MARAFPVPVYITTTSSPSPFSVDQRALSTTSPGTTDSTATSCNGNTLGVQHYFKPEQAAGSGDSGPLLAVGTAAGFGWALIPVGPLAPTADDGFTVEAGDWTFPVHYSRAGGLGTGDMPCVFSVVLFRMSSDLSTVMQEIGRVSGSSVTVGTTEASQNLTIAGALAVFAPGEMPYFEVHVNQATSLLVAAKRLHTNSSTATRISAAPNYTRQHHKALSDSPPITDGMGRVYIGARALADNAPASDGLARVVTFPRALTDNAPATDGGTGNVLTADEADFETSSAGWSGLGGTVARSTAQAHSGSASLIATKTGSTGNLSVRSPLKSGFSPGQKVAIYGWIRNDTTLRQGFPSIAWWTAADAFISQTFGPTLFTESAGTWIFFVLHGTAPATTAKASMNFTWGSVAVGESHYIDDCAISVTALARQMMYGRALADNSPSSDALARQFTGARALADSSAVTDDLARMFNGARSLEDVAGIPSDSLERLAIFNRALADGASASDAIERAFMGARLLEDGAGAADDDLLRQVVYDRQLEDSLSEGGGTIIKKSPIYIFPDED